MLTLTTELTIDLDTLDNRNEAVARLSAVLRDLQGEWAAMTIPEQSGATCLHWGTRVRFWIPDGKQIYEAIGTIVEQRPTEESESTSGMRGRIAGQQEVIVRLAECRTLPQRRVTPRRMARFAVEYRMLASEDAVEPSPDSDGTEADTGSDWQSATCVDIGVGGMRLRTEQRDEWPKRIALQFRLPAYAGRQVSADATALPFHVVGRILRVAPVRARSGGAEVVVAFDCLPVSVGMRLSAFLCNSAGS